MTKNFWRMAGPLFALMLVCSCTSMDQGGAGRVTVSDNELYTTVVQRLEMDDVTGDYTIGVSVQAGHVLLQGSVPDPAVRARARNIVLGTPGVWKVIDEMGW